MAFVDIEATFDILVPEYKDLPDPDLEKFYELTLPFVPEDKWGDVTAQAQSYLMGHMIAMSNKGGSGGSSVKREKVGQLEREYGTVDVSDTILMETSYGREFLRIRKRCVVSPFIVC